MSISAKPWDSAGGGASVPDASETTKGKIKIATTSESNTGTDDLTAMTPAKVKARIDAALVGGVEYKGTWNATTGLPTLINAVTGDLYKVDTLGTIYGKVWAVGDQLIINDDMGGSITNSKIDKIDNTEAVTSVNGLTGPVLLSMDHIHDVISGSSSSGDLLMYDGNDWNNTPKSSIAVSAFNDDNTYQPKDAQLTDVAGLTPADGKFIVGDGSNFVTESGSTARASLGLVIGTDVQAFDAQLTDVAGLTPADGKFIVGDGSNFVTESGSTARASLGLVIGTDVQAFDAQLTDVAGLTPADSAFIVGDGSNFVTESGSTARASLGLVIGTDVSAIASPAFTGSPTAPTQSAGDDSTNIATTAYVDAAVTAGGGATNLNGLSDVTITSAAPGNLLQHNGSGQFVNIAKSTINVGTFNDDNTYQPKDAQLTDVAGLTPADGKFIVGDGSNFVTESGSTARASLGLVIGTDVQAFDAQLTDVAGLTPADGKFIVGDGSNFVTESGATARASLGLVIGTDVSAIASPAFTGSPTAPTQSAGDDSTKLATTAYVDAAVVAGGGLSSVVQDTSPELGGNLDVLARSIVSSSNRAITLTPDGSGLVTISGNATSGSGQIQLNCEQNSHGIKIKGPPHSATASYTLTLPDDVGSAGQFLKTDGSGGTLTWGTASATDATKLAILNNLSDLDNAGTARTNLGLVIGTNVQAYDLGLTSIAGLTTAADKMIFTDGSDSYAVTGLTSAGRALLDDADASAQRTTLGLVIGTDVAPIAAPAFTGNATAVTQSQSDGSTKIATTAYVDTAVAQALAVVVVILIALRLHHSQLQLTIIIAVPTLLQRRYQLHRATLTSPSELKLWELTL
jgi:hypothetical protein